MEPKIKPWVLQQRQSLPLELKIIMTQNRIKAWYDYFEGDVYISFSGGKDSTVLRHLVNNTPGVYDIPSVFCDTGLEYPEVRNHALKYADEVIRPQITFKQVIEQYGYPIPSKEQAQFIREARTTNSAKLRELRLNGRPNGRSKISKKYLPLLDAPFKVSEQCCNIMKKKPFHNYEKSSNRKPIIGTMACESALRKQRYLSKGCNAFEDKRPMSTPIIFWTEQDILKYIQQEQLEYPSIYGEIISKNLFNDELALTGAQRTGCMFCMFGVQLDDHPNRFERMKETHPKQYDYCINKLGLSEVLDYMHISY